MIVAHLSDLHLRTEDDAVEFGRQLDCIAATTFSHLVITGDLLDRWHPPLLERALNVLAARQLLDARRLTIIHGNHDLASSGGHPRQRSDLWRMAARFWDPPPLVHARRLAFYRLVNERVPGIGLRPGTSKAMPEGLRFASVDSVRAPWLPVRLAGRVVTLRHAEGAIPHAQLEWLSSQQGAEPLVVLVHHYPLPVGSFRWSGSGPGRRSLVSRLGWQVDVPMAVDAETRSRFWRAVEAAGASVVLCGHVHRARLEQHGRIAVGLNGESGADWAGRTIAYYRIDRSGVTARYERSVARPL